MSKKQFIEFYFDFSVNHSFLFFIFSMVLLVSLIWIIAMTVREFIYPLKEKIPKFYFFLFSLISSFVIFGLIVYLTITPYKGSEVKRVVSLELLDRDKYYDYEGKEKIPVYMINRRDSEIMVFYVFNPKNIKDGEYEVLNEILKTPYGKILSYNVERVCKKGKEVEDLWYSGCLKSEKIIDIKEKKDKKYE